MANVGHQRRLEDTERNSPFGLACGAVTLTQFWSVRLPRRLDPWAPRVADSFSDGTWTAVWQVVAGFAPLVAFVVGVLTPLLWPGMRHVYTESLLFMMLVIAGAILSGPVGVMMLLGYVMGMCIWGSPPIPMRYYYSGAYFFHRGGSLLISYLLLAIPAVIVPQQVRQMAEEVPLPNTTSLEVRILIRALLYAAGCSLLIYAWCQAMVVLIRPVFTWVGSQPEVNAIAPLQQRWYWLIAVAAVAGVMRMGLEGMALRRLPRATLVEELQEQRWANFERRGGFWQSVPVLLRVGITSAMVTLVLSGAYQGWIDAVLVAAAVAGLEAWRAGAIGGFPDWWVRAVLKLPALLRFVIALLLGYLLSQWLITHWWLSQSFRPVLLGTVLTLVLFYILFPRRTEGQGATPERREMA